VAPSRQVVDVTDGQEGAIRDHRRHHARAALMTDTRSEMGPIPRRCPGLMRRPIGQELLDEALQTASKGKQHIFDWAAFA